MIIFLCLLVFLIVTGDFLLWGERWIFKYANRPHAETVKSWASNPFLRAGLRVALGKIKISGTRYRLNDCVIFIANT